MELKRIHWFGIASGFAVIAMSFLLFNTKFFFFIIWFGVLIIVAPFVLTTIQETRTNQEKEEMFLEFTRNLVESVNTGTPISKSIMNMKKKSFGVLSKNVEKLANQISMGIPLRTALQVFANDIGNETVLRTITLIGQAERAGGNIAGILESVAKAVNTADKLRKERRAAISTLVVQGYIIFLVFIVIILVMQFYIIPMISGIATVGVLGTGGVSTPATGGAIEATEVSRAFLYLLLIQGFFSGLAIGKLSEGDIKAGIKHSFALVVLSFLISAVANIFFAK
ncbi:type II secretion system F family protein [Candidatus Pacearchaeota archaeon]|nr:type II secretion system F family protein [Candidatus Pacearchaeota archaeon]